VVDDIEVFSAAKELEFDLLLGKCWPVAGSADCRIGQWEADTFQDWRPNAQNFFVVGRLAVAQRKRGSI
jgi:hypothetical protein